MKVLIAEDDSTSAIVLRKALEKLGHEAIVATDGEQAYSLLSRDTAFEYRVIISDWMMPGMDGLELTRKIRGERGPGTPYRFVILLTARGRPEDRRTGLEAGADDFMVKPLDMGDLIPRLSVAERMLALEDSVLAKFTPPEETAVVSPSAVPTEENTALPAASEPTDLSFLQGEEAAKQILLVALRDHEASEVHFEPQADETYQVRARDKNGSLRDLPDAGDALLAAKYLLPKANDKTVLLDLSGMPVMATVAALPTVNGDRVRVALLPDSLRKATTRLSEMPMRASVRLPLEALLHEGKRTGGILFVAGARRDSYLKNKTLAALRYFVSDPDTIILDDTYSRRQDRLLAQNPDVIVSYDFGAKSGEASYIFAAQVQGVLVLTATDGRVGSSSPVYPTLLGTLTIAPLAADGSNAGDRYELKSADDLLPLHKP